MNQPISPRASAACRSHEGYTVKFKLHANSKEKQKSTSQNDFGCIRCVVTPFNIAGAMCESIRWNIFTFFFISSDLVGFRLVDTFAQHLVSKLIWENLRGCSLGWEAHQSYVICHTIEMRSVQNMLVELSIYSISVGDTDSKKTQTQIHP